jgi:cellulose synthase/poly-beta-1,6-N-acetylglucosamine synthase-like glycosyltransferase
VIVIADNCNDDTRGHAETAGARVLVRDDPGRRGKGWALAFAFECLVPEALADAFVVVDADTLVSRNLLAAFAARIQAGREALQARYGVRNPEQSRRTRLLRLALTLFHDVRSQGRERLGLSCGLRGNGMAFSRRLLLEVPYEAYSLVEDLEYGIHLGLLGHRVEYVGEACVLGEMASTEQAARSQRRRWEGGRLQLARQYLARLLQEAWRRRSLVLLDLALDLVVPPLSYLALAVVLGLLLSLVGLVLGLRTLAGAVLWGLAALALIMHLVRGVRSSGLGMRAVGDLLFAPAFVLWKLGLWLRSDPGWRGEWVRTPRAKRVK